jgi:hypothetical protein
MKTTQIIIEHLIAGIQMLIWLALFVFSLTGTDWYTPEAWHINSTAALAISVAFVYPFGIIIDNIADRLLKGREKKIRASIPGGQQSMRKLLLQLDDADITDSFNYIRMRIRISRSACINFVMMTIAALTFVGAQLNGNDTYFAIALIFGPLLIFLSYFSWQLLTKSCYSKLAKRYKELSPQSSNES